MESYVGKGRGSNPNSKKGLKKIQPGEVLNPEGARAHDPHKKMLKKITNNMVKEIIEIGLTGTLKDLENIVKDENEMALKRGLAKAMGDAVASGSFDMLEKMFEKLIGRVPIEIHQTVTNLQETPEEAEERRRRVQEKMRALSDLS